MFTRGRVFPVATYALMLVGCATPLPKTPSEFAAHWKMIRVGMSAAEVHRLLVRPPFTSYEPTDSTEHIEYWLFTHTDFSDVPPAEAYVIWFTTDWKVKGFRARGSAPVPYDI